MNRSDFLSQIVQTFPLKLIDDMKRHYRKQLTKTPNGAIFRAKTNNCVITGYRSGKVLFQGTDPEKEVKHWSADGKQHAPVRKKSVNKNTNFHPPETLYSTYHIGSDEAGTGDYFGPITVGATYVTPTSIDKLKEIGVKDSKDLSDKRIRELANEIISLHIPYALLVLPNEKYNKLRKAGWTQGKMKSIMHHHAIQKLLHKIERKPMEGILIDQFCDPAIYKRHISSESEYPQEKLYFKTKAESYSIAVAAGSILARTRFVQEMDLLSKHAGITLPKGASQKVDKVIAAVKQKHGVTYLNSCAKVHFANTHKADAYL